MGILRKFFGLEHEELPDISGYLTVQKKKKQAKLSRPKNLNEILGQQDVKLTLKIYMEAAKRRKETLDHLLLAGPPGLGKTTISSVIATEMGHKFMQDTGPNLTLDNLGTYVREIKMSAGRIPVCFFVDEIHGINKKVMTVFLPLMEDFLYEGRKIPEFTLIGATTDPADLLRPMRQRFGITYTLQYYEVPDLMQILQRNLAITLGISFEEMQQKVDEMEDLRLAIESIAKRSTGTARIANLYLRRIIDFGTIKAPHGYLLFTPEVVSEAMMKMGIDIYGLTPLHRKILVTMYARYSSRPVGLGAISSAIGESVKTIEEIAEPILLRLELINRESRGRALTEFGVLVAKNELDGKTQY